MSLTQEDLRILLLQMNHISLSMTERMILAELKHYFTRSLREARSESETGECLHRCKLPIGTQRMKICTDCGTKWEWNLDTGQLSAYGDINEKTQRDYKDVSP